MKSLTVTIQKIKATKQYFPGLSCCIEGGGGGGGGLTFQSVDDTLKSDDSNKRY